MASLEGTRFDLRKKLPHHFLFLVAIIVGTPMNESLMINSKYPEDTHQKYYQKYLVHIVHVKDVEIFIGACGVLRPKNTSSHNFL